jgi:hypothetical protein
VIFLATELVQCANHFVRITRVKVFLEAFHQLELELGFGQHRSVDRLGRARIVATLVRPFMLTSAGTAENVLRILRGIVQGIVLVNRLVFNVMWIRYVLPLSLAVTALLLLGTIKVAGLFVRCLFARDIAFGSPFFGCGLVLVCFVVAAAVGVFGSLGLGLRGNRADAFACRVTDLAL